MRTDIKGLEYGGRNITFSRDKFTDTGPISRGFVGDG